MKQSLAMKKVIIHFLKIIFRSFIRRLICCFAGDPVVVDDVVDLDERLTPEMEKAMIYPYVLWLFLKMLV